MYLLDGVFSAMFTIPEDNHPDKIIRITPSSYIRNADVSPNYYSGDEHFQMIDIFRMPNLEGILEQFRRGYSDAIRNRDKLISKGLKLKSKEKGGGCNNFLNDWLSFLKKHGEEIFAEDYNDKSSDNNNANDNNKSRHKMNFSQFSLSTSKRNL